MNKKLLFILSLICAVAVNAQRLQTKGLCGGPVNLLPASGTNLFTGSSTVGIKPLPKITNNSSLNLTIYKHTLPSEYSNIAFWYITEDSGNVWMCGDSGKIVRASLSNLNDWQLRNSGIDSNETISWLEFIDTSTIFAAGGNGTIYETIDAGLNWTVSFSDTSITSYIDKIKFFTPTNGVAVGDQPVSASGAPMAFLETTDGGKTWTNNNTFILGYANYDVVSFQPPSNAFLLGYYNYNSNLYEGIWSTSDLGKDWKFNSVGNSSLDSTVSSYAEAFKDAYTGIVAKADSTVWLTVNGGISWLYIEKFPVLAYSVCFVPNTDYAFAGGVNGLLAKINIDSLTSEIQYDVDTTTYSFVNFVSLSNGYLIDGGSTGCFFSTIDTLILKRGDVDGNTSGGPDAYSASLVLKYLADLDTLNAQQLAEAEVDGNPGITANDAYWVLYATAYGTFPDGSLPKTAQAQMGSISVGQMSSQENSDLVTIPIILQKSQGIHACYLQLNIDSRYADVNNVAAGLPKGWLMVHNYVNGALKIAMAGVTPLTDGTIAAISLNLKNKGAKFVINGSAKLNANLNSQISGFTVQTVPGQFGLSQNYPNPFNPSTVISYQLAQDSHVSLTIFDMLGQKVKTLVNVFQQAGYYNITWDGTNDSGRKAASGIYIYRIKAGNFIKTLKMNVLK